MNVKHKRSAKVKCGGKLDWGGVCQDTDNIFQKVFVDALIMILKKKEVISKLFLKKKHFS